MDLQNGKLFNTYTGHKNSNYRSKVSFGGVKEDRISFGDEEGVVREWDVESVSLVSSLFFRFFGRGLCRACLSP